MMYSPAIIPPYFSPLTISDPSSTTSDHNASMSYYYQSYSGNRKQCDRPTISLPPINRLFAWSQQSSPFNMSLPYYHRQCVPPVSSNNYQQLRECLKESIPRLTTQNCDEDSMTKENNRPIMPNPQKEKNRIRGRDYCRRLSAGIETLRTILPVDYRTKPLTQLETIRKTIDYIHLLESKIYQQEQGEMELTNTNQQVKRDESNGADKAVDYSVNKND